MIQKDFIKEVEKQIRRRNEKEENTNIDVLLKQLAKELKKEENNQFTISLEDGMLHLCREPKHRGSGITTCVIDYAIKHDIPIIVNSSKNYKNVLKSDYYTDSLNIVETIEIDINGKDVEKLRGIEYKTYLIDGVFSLETIQKLYEYGNLVGFVYLTK